MERWFCIEGEDDPEYGFGTVSVDVGVAARAIAAADDTVYDLCDPDRRHHYDDLAEAAIRAIGGEPIT